ncbi:hypothetical protein DENSPDRAFT_886769 [Dentipellis sp. KUC8613]|nr:hypothetical protein DENSPDRAFT_886769 [Dentipellis sp. KUC8613]
MSLEECCIDEQPVGILFKPGIPGSRLPVPAHAPAVAPCRAPVAPRPRCRYPPPRRHPVHLFPPALASSRPCRALSRPVVSLLRPVAPVAPVAPRCTAVAPQCASVVPPSCPLAPSSHAPPLCRVAPLLSPALAQSRPVVPPSRVARVAPPRHLCAPPCAPPCRLRAPPCHLRALPPSTIYALRSVTRRQRRRSIGRGPAPPSQPPHRRRLPSRRCVASSATPIPPLRGSCNWISGFWCPPERPTDAPRAPPRSFAPSQRRLAPRRRPSPCRHPPWAVIMAPLRCCHALTDVPCFAPPPLRALRARLHRFCAPTLSARPYAVFALYRTPFTPHHAVSEPPAALIRRLPPSSTARRPHPPPAALLCPPPSRLPCASVLCTYSRAPQPPSLALSNPAHLLESCALPRIPSPPSLAPWSRMCAPLRPTCLRPRAARALSASRVAVMHRVALQSRPSCTAITRSLAPLRRRTSPRRVVCLRDNAPHPHATVLRRHRPLPRAVTSHPGAVIVRRRDDALLPRLGPVVTRPLVARPLTKMPRALVTISAT